MVYEKPIPIDSFPEIVHQLDKKTGMHIFTMNAHGSYYQQVLSSETFVAMTPAAMTDYFYVMRKQFDKFVYGKTTEKPSWMGANHKYFVEDEAYTPEWKSYVKQQKSKEKEKDVSYLAWDLPGMQIKMTCPDKECENPDHIMKLYHMIIHLNDTHKWPRENIADWLETLDADLSFKTPTEKKVEIL